MKLIPSAEAKGRHRAMTDSDREVVQGLLKTAQEEGLMGDENSANECATRIILAVAEVNRVRAEDPERFDPGVIGTQFNPINSKVSQRAFALILSQGADDFDAEATMKFKS